MNVRLWGGPMCGKVVDDNGCNDKLRVWKPEPISMRQPLETDVEISVPIYEYSLTPYHDSKGLRVFAMEEDGIEIDARIHAAYQTHRSLFGRTPRAFTIPRLVWSRFEKYMHDQQATRVNPAAWTEAAVMGGLRPEYQGMKVFWGDELKMLDQVPVDFRGYGRPRPDQDPDEWRRQYEGEYQEVRVPRGRNRWTSVGPPSDSHAYSAIQAMRDLMAIMGREVGAPPPEQPSGPMTGNHRIHGSVVVTSQRGRRNRVSIWAGPVRVIFEGGRVPPIEKFSGNDRAALKEREELLHRKFLQAVQNSMIQYGPVCECRDEKGRPFYNNMLMLPDKIRGYSAEVHLDEGAM